MFNNIFNVKCQSKQLYVMGVTKRAFHRVLTRLYLCRDETIGTGDEDENPCYEVGSISALAVDDWAELTRGEQFWKDTSFG